MSRMTMHGMLSRLGLVFAFWLAFAGVARAATIDVTRTDDRAATCAPTDCSLREALAAAAASGDTIQLGGTVSAPLNYSVTLGQLVITKTVTIAGTGAKATTINGAGNDNRVLRVDVGGALTLQDLKVTQSTTEFEGSDPLQVDGGHALYNGATATVNRVVFLNNGNASSVGGAISNRGTLTVNDTDFQQNVAGYGGAIDSRSGTVAINRSTFRHNAGNSGGATMHLRGGTVSITNSTVDTNGSFGAVGGIYNKGATLSLLNATLARNVNNSLRTDAGTTTVKNTVFVFGFDDTCAAGAVTTNGGGNIDDGGTCGVGSAQAAYVAPLADNGGPTQTAALLSRSPAIANPLATGCPATDQRGFTRTVCDSGAVAAIKLGAPTATTVSATVNSFTGTVNFAGEAGALSFEFELNGGGTGFTTGLGAGVVSSPSTRTETAFGYNTPPGSYQYRAVAENATGIAYGEWRTFVVPELPKLSGLQALDVSDTTITLRFTLDPKSPDAGYYLRINGEDTPLTPVAGSAPREITRTVTGLDPGSNNELRVIATNPGGSTDTDGHMLNRFTLQRKEATVGQVVTFGRECNQDATVAWGDGRTSTATCTGFELHPEHTYTEAGRYRIKVTYPGGYSEELVAAIAPASTNRLLTVSIAGNGRVVGNGIHCPGVCSVELPENTAVSLTASGDGFQGWSNGCSGTGACTFTLAGDRNVTADFAGAVAAAPVLEPPTVTEIGAASAKLNFRIDPQGSYSHYRLVIDGIGTTWGEAGPGLVGFTHDLAGLQASTRYEGRVTAMNAAGESSDTFAFTTPAAPAPTPDPTPDPIVTPVPTPVPTPTPTPTPSPVPTAAVDVVAEPVRGTVVVKVPGTSRFVALVPGQELPYGTEIDTRKGRVELTAIPKAGSPPESAVFYGGRFKVSYVGGITNVTLSEPLAACPKPKGKASAAQKKKAKSRKLWGDGKGSFRTSGRYSAATVRGTKWFVQDSCAGTLTRVSSGVVSVRDNVKKKTVTLRAGKRYLATAKR